MYLFVNCVDEASRYWAPWIKSSHPSKNTFCRPWLAQVAVANASLKTPTVWPPVMTIQIPCWTVSCGRYHLGTRRPVSAAQRAGNPGRGQLEFPARAARHNARHPFGRHIKVKLHYAYKVRNIGRVRPRLRFCVLC